MTSQVSGTPADISPDAEQALVGLVVRGMVRGEVSAEVQQLVDAGLATTRGPVTSPSREGTQRAAAALRLPDDDEATRTIRSLYEAFLPLNRSLREVCTAWQCRPDGSVNDHVDASYDAHVRDQLDDIHSGIRRLLRRLSTAAPSLAHYSDELEGALEKLDAGDPSMLTSPLSPSYHTVWMWLHQELLLMLGISRADDEALEEQLVSGRAG